jgi:hypothetical protein
MLQGSSRDLAGHRLGVKQLGFSSRNLEKPESNHLHSQHFLAIL